MISQELHKKISDLVVYLQKFTDRIWYAPFVGLLSLLDNFVIVIPNDGILISSSILVPKRWLSLALSVAIGSTAGAIALAAIVQIQGLPWILNIYPGLTEGQTWILTSRFFDKYGLYLIFFVGLTPLAQQPGIILASLAKTSLFDLTMVLFAGRLIKYLLLSYLGSHAPRLITKMWGLKGELKDAGVKIKGD